jgi:phosphatidylethanolamine/phosphatidyl-N-methylethanolamine N-methyltransferase
MLADCHGFLRNFIRNPRATGAVAPATDALSRSVAKAVQEAYARHPCPGGLPVLELGAGTGALTNRISRLQPVLVERDPGWAGLLRHRFPALEVREECASEALRQLQAPTGIVSSIPLLNNPQSGDLKQLLADRYAHGLIRFCVLYTYGWTNPLAGRGFRRARRASFVARSFPPAHVWLYE